MTASVLIVGASVAGVGAANELRRCGYAGAITLVDGQPHLPYDRPPLSKAALGHEPVAPQFHEAQHYADRQVTLRLGTPAVALDATNRTVTLSSGEALTAEAVILATGARARRLPSTIAAGPVHVIRDLDDAAALQPLLQPGRRLVMIGGGFIGAEVAATAIARGVDVTIVDRDPLPLASVVGDLVAGRVADLHRQAGVRLICGVGVTAIEESHAGQTVVLDDGTRIVADIVVAGIGSMPNVEWLISSGVALGDGVLCDASGRTSAPGIYAAGDVAAWQASDGREHHRHEHWTAAREQARIVAQSIASVADAHWHRFVPYFWSDMHGKRVQLLGSSAGATAVQIVFDNPDTGAFVAEYERDGRLIGVAGCNAAGRVMRYAARLSE